MSIGSNNFKILLGKAGEKNPEKSRLAVVNKIENGQAYITFYGEEVPSQKPYKRLSTYIPSAGDTVVLVKINNSYVIIGKVV